MEINIDLENPIQQLIALALAGFITGFLISSFAKLFIWIGGLIVWAWYHFLLKNKEGRARAGNFSIEEKPKESVLDVSKKKVKIR